MMPPPLHHKKRDEPEDEGWLITFADMSVLLMCFFVLLFSISTPDVQQMKAVAESLRKKGFYNDAIPTEDPYEKVKKDITLSLGQSGFDKFAAVTESPRSIDIELSSGAFFVPGSAKFTAQAVPMLEQVTRQVIPLAKADVVIEVEGHTDDSPVASDLYPSNWELSAARAANLVRFLAAKGFPEKKLRVIGRGATAPKAPNHDSAGTAIPANQELNRRVVVKLVKGDDW